jgi:hypothetical protein
VGFELRALPLKRQMLYHLSHDVSPYCSGYFGDVILLFAKLSLDSAPPVLGFPLWLG